MVYLSYNKVWVYNLKTVFSAMLLAKSGFCTQGLSPDKLTAAQYS